VLPRETIKPVQRFGKNSRERGLIPEGKEEKKSHSWGGRLSQSEVKKDQAKRFKEEIQKGLTSLRART